MSNNVFCPFIRLAGLEIMPKGAHVAKRLLLDYELFFLTKGSGELFINDKVIQTKKHEIYLIEPGISHYHEFAPSELYWIHFDLFYSAKRNDSYVVPAGQDKISKKDLKLMQPRLSDHLETDIAIGHAPLDRYRVQYCFEKIVKLSQTTPAMWQLQAQGLICELINMFAPQKESKKTSLSLDQRIERTITYMRAQVHNPLDLTTLAATANLSPYYYAHQFKKMYKVSPVKYHNQLRLQHAMNKLKTGEYSISEIAATYGYDNVFNFSRSFKSTYGKSPKHYLP